MKGTPDVPPPRKEMTKSTRDETHPSDYTFGVQLVSFQHIRQVLVKPKTKEIWPRNHRPMANGLKSLS